MRAFFFLAFLLTAMICKSQNPLTSTIRWTADRATDLKTNNDFAFQCVFQTNENSVEWIQKSGSFVQHFNVTSTDGTWNDVQQAGEITFHVSHNGQTGTVVAKRTSAGVSITVDFTGSNSYAPKHEFRINQVTEN